MEQWVYCPLKERVLPTTTTGTMTCHHVSMMLHTGQLQSFKGSGNIVLPGTLLLDQPHFELVMMQYLPFGQNCEISIPTVCVTQ